MFVCFHLNLSAKGQSNSDGCKILIVRLRVRTFSSVHNIKIFVYMEVRCDKVAPCLSTM